MTSNEIRASFLKYFEKNGHRILPSSSLVPQDDPTLLFTNAGMNQFKDVFLGKETRDYTRATTCQKCMRVSGKHNDLENVGPSPSHHTFFQMLGNFSFGDYFKKEAVGFAWQLLTEIWKIPADKLFVTVFRGESGVPRDEEAWSHWLKYVSNDHLSELGSADNFWQMGETGPCGRCSEIYYFRGDHIHCPEPDCKGVECSCSRYIEIWNLVFMEFDRQADGRLKPLPKPSIDTGMGLERVTAVLQSVESNYDTDLFQPLMKRAAQLCAGQFVPEGAAIREETEGAASLRVIADHARAATFLITDDVLPSNEGRGYVLRKIIRRAIRHGRLLGSTQPFLAEMARTVADVMGGAYPEVLGSDTWRVKRVLVEEETRFARTLERGLEELEAEIVSTARSFGHEVVDRLDTEAMLRRYTAGAFDWDLNGNGVADPGEMVDPSTGLPAVLPRETVTDYGIYSQILYGFRKGWVVGLRGDYVAPTEKARYEAILGGDLDRASRYRISPNLTWYPSEFSKLRLQYNYDDRNGIGQDHSIWLQFEFLLGAHAAHKF